jgi:DUF4097 and DUF4098 domain-containing protein YvlB
MSHMHRTLTLLVAGLLAAAAPAAAQDRPPRDREVQRDRRVVVERSQSREQRDEQTERFTRTLKIGSNGEVMLANISGNVTVTRGGGNDATLEVIKTARARSADEAKELLGLVQVDITERGNRADVKTRYPQDEWRRSNRRNFNVSVAYNLAAPAGTRVSVNSVSGDISASDITGDLSLESVSGSVRIESAGRVAAAKSVSGNVEIIDTEIQGQLESASVSGTVTLRKVKALRAELGSVSGSVVLEDVDCERLEAQTVSGDVEFAGSFTRSGRYELSSHSGTVQVHVSGNVGFELEATSFSGSVRSDIPLKSQSRGGSRGPQRSLEGVYGDGSAILELSTFSGSIVVTKR